MRYSEEFKDKVVNDYINGVRVYDLSKDYGISMSTIYRWLDEGEIPHRKRIYSEEFKNKVIKEYDKGSSGPELAKKYGMSTTSLYIWLKDRGVNDG